MSIFARWKARQRYGTRHFLLAYCFVPFVSYMNPGMICDRLYNTVQVWTRIRLSGNSATSRSKLERFAPVAKGGVPDGKGSSLVSL